MNLIRQDLRFGFRMLVKRPATTTLAVVALALGIGLTTTMFSIVNGAFLRGLPFPEGDRLMHVGRINLDRAGAEPGGTTIHDFVDWRASQTSFESLSGYESTSANIAGDGIAPMRLDAARFTPDLLGQLRVRPILGREFRDADAVPGAPRVALIADSVWATPFNRDPHIVGRVVRINGEPTEIIGVMPAKFGFPEAESVWLPLSFEVPSKRGEGPRLTTIGRLKPGVSLAKANTELAAIAARLATSFTENARVGAGAQDFIGHALGTEVIAVLSTMLVAVIGVLLIACVNVTNLQLARAADRTKEVAVRMAMGASRRRLIRQLLVEGLMLSATGAVAGLAIALGGCRLFMAGIADTNPPFWIDVRVDPTVLLFVLALSVLAALASSLVPAFRVTRQNLHDVLKDSGRGNTSLHLGRFSRILVVAEMALSFCLLVVSGLMVRSVIENGRVQYPFKTEIMTARLTWPSNEYADDAHVLQTHDRLLSQLAMTPGVRAVALATALPDFAGTSFVAPEGRPAPAKGEPALATRRVVASPEFFDTLRIATRRGRLFDARDRAGVTPVAVVSEDFAATVFPGQEALGRRVRLGLDKGDADPWWTIIGIVPTVTVTDRASGDATMAIFLPMAQRPERGVTVFASVTTDQPTFVSALRREVGAINPDVPLFNINSIAELYHSRAWPLRVFGSLFMSFGLAALLLASAGLYGVMAFAVRRRTQEIGVRMALGADRGTILRMVLKQGTTLVLIGMAIGVAAGGKLGDLMRVLLYRVDAWDPVVFGVTTGVLMLTGLLASVIPAMRAASVDPLSALRND